ncbi:probable WRKY transcription factor 70 [Phtheirospermum japonicum]|uniref:Probable WRKY transcription factor 70 n=1 Tax=Phtheirospermum japonicum TaxID=374723 RepID=A0A830C510_9LAMI|nr:probable WRKY transcription factor 70 [Phtheirospermum japonicum]
MGRFRNNGDFHAKRGKMIMELLKGRQIATRLQTLLHEPAREDDGGLGLAQQLALQILRSFTETLSEMGSCAESAQIAAVDCGVSTGGRKKGPPGVKERRGCYKRRRTADSWVTVSSTKEDGCAWRKYGQKAIMSSTYPRCYFRCTFKSEGCKATKQVQRTKENPIMYQTTYFNHHTCTEKLRHPHDLIVDSNPVEPNLISFETNIQSKQDQYSPNPMSSISQVKDEFKEDNARSDQDLGSDEAKSTLQDPWQDFDHTGLESLGYKPEWAPIASSYQDEVGSGFDQSYEATSLHGLEEVNQLGDIDYSWYFD